MFTSTKRGKICQTGAHLNRFLCHLCHLYQENTDGRPPERASQYSSDLLHLWGMKPRIDRVIEMSLVEFGMREKALKTIDLFTLYAH
jgi:hypothetical protein